MSSVKILLLASLVSCSVLPQRSPAVGTQTAAAYVWYDAYKRTDKTPTVYVVEATCTSTVNGQPGFNCPGTGCRNGCTTNPWYVSITFVQPWSRSTLAHEFMHVLKLRKAIEAGKSSALIDLAGDRNHADPEWQVGSDVDLANAGLEMRGM